MKDEFKKRQKALEDDYFRKEEAKTIENLATKQSARLSPINGKPMVTMMRDGVEIDYCEESGGMWLDKGELEKLIENNQKSDNNWFNDLLKDIGLK